MAPEFTSDDDPADIPDRLIDVKQAALLREIAAGVGAAVTAAILAELVLIKTNTGQTEINLQTTGPINLSVDDLEQLTRDISLLMGTLGANTGGSTYNETLTVAAADAGDNTTLLTLSVAALTGYEAVAKVGNQLTLGGAAPNAGTYEVLAVDGLTIVIDAQFVHAATAAVSIDTLDSVDPNSQLGRLYAMRQAFGAFAAASPGSGIALGVDDAGNLLLLTADATSKGLNAHIVSSPAHEETGATDAYRNIIVNAAGALLGDAANPVRIQRTIPSALISDTQDTHGTPGTATNPFTGAPVNSITIQNDPGNTGNLSVGDATSQDVLLIPGASIDGLEIDDLSKIWVKNTVASEAVNIFGS